MSDFTIETYIEECRERYERVQAYEAEPQETRRTRSIKALLLAHLPEVAWPFVHWPDFDETKNIVSAEIRLPDCAAIRAEFTYCMDTLANEPRMLGFHEVDVQTAQPPVLAGGSYRLDWNERPLFKRTDAENPSWRELVGRARQEWLRFEAAS